MQVTGHQQQSNDGGSDHGCFDDGRVSGRRGALTPVDPSWTPSLIGTAPTRQRVDSISFTPMARRLRNELITQCYGDISDEMAVILGTSDATWSTYAHWASRTIGDYLSVPIPDLGKRIARAFAFGNRDVFADIGRAHTVFLSTVGVAARVGTDLDLAWNECEAELAIIQVEPPGSPAAGADDFWDGLTTPSGARSNRLLIIGFSAYRKAIDEPDAELKSQLILLGNALVGLHEQQRLSFAISMGFRSWLRRLTTLWRPLETNREWALKAPGTSRIRLENTWIRFATKRLIAVKIPGSKVRVGKAVPSTDVTIRVDRLGLTSQHRCSDIDSLDPVVMLRLLYDRFDVNFQPVDCWNDLADRMSFIIGLFASTQRSPIWFDKAGKTVRVPQWPGFERLVAVQQNRLHASPATCDVDCPVPSILSDSYLDSLRQLRTYPLPDDATRLSFGAVNQAGFRSDYLDSVRDDVASRYDTMATVGLLLDRRAANKARRMFGDWETLVYMALLFRSLPDTYAAARGVKVIGSISDLATDPFRRAGETARFVDDLLGSSDGWDNGLLVKGRDAYNSIEGVRAIHAIAASQLLKSGWDSVSYGMPLNQEDILGTALSFSVPVFEMMDQFNIDVSDEIRDCYTQFWLGVGYLLGAPLEAVTREGSRGRVPLTYTEAQAVAHAIRRRHHVRSLDGVRLSEALLEGVGDGFPRSFDWMATGLIQTVGDPEVVALLLVGHGQGRERAAAAAGALRFGLRVRLLRGLTRKSIDTLGQRWLAPFLDEGASRPYRRPQLAGTRRSPPIGRSGFETWPLGCGGYTPEASSLVNLV